MILQNLEKYDDTMVNKFIQEAILHMLNNHGYGDIKLVVYKKKVCSIIPSPLYCLGANKSNLKGDKSFLYKEFSEDINLLFRLIKEIRENTGFGVINIGINARKIVTIKPTPLPGRYMYKIY